MRRNHTTRIAFAILAIAFFATPIAARTIGITAEQFENRRFAAAPTLSQGWDAFAQTTQFLTDRMPLRKQAVETNTHIWTSVFNTDPDYSGRASLGDDRALPFAGAAGPDSGEGSEVGAGTATSSAARTGQRGWLFNDRELKDACDATHDRAILRRWGRVIRTIRASGREAAMFVAPAKASVYPEHLPDEYPGDHCALEAKERFWRLLSEEGPRDGTRELRSDLVRLKEYAGDALFYRKDTHWSTLGAMALVKAVLEELGGDIRLKPNEIVKRGTATYTGDLTVLSGRAETERAKDYAISREPGAPRVPGRTLLICDSFAGKWVRLLRPYFEHIEPVALAGVEAADMIEAMRRSDTVIIEAMETGWKNPAYSRELVYWLRWESL